MTNALNTIARFAKHWNQVTGRWYRTGKEQWVRTHIKVTNGCHTTMWIPFAANHN